ncbi:MAG: hypothetical protein ACK5DV_11500 [Planctomycetota bacterium]
MNAISNARAKLGKRIDGYLFLFAGGWLNIGTIWLIFGVFCLGNMIYDGSNEIAKDLSEDANAKEKLIKILTILIDNGGSTNGK